MSPDTVTLKTTMRHEPRVRLRSTTCLRGWADLQRREEHIACKKSVQNPVQLEMPSQDEFVKLLITGNLQNAEVVELADTPS
jgi:hypothetical protein